MITEGGFKIVSLKLTTLADAIKVLCSSLGKTILGELVEFMTRGPIVAV
jgi:nucleoside diphosphate kinase